MVEHIDTLCWAVMLALFVGIEAATPQLVSIWFAAGSLVSGIISLITGSIPVQIIAFVKHVRLLNPQGDLVVPDASKCVFCVKNMQIKD